MSGAIYECKDMNILAVSLEKPWHPMLVKLYLWELTRYGSERIMVTCAWEERDYSSVHSVIPLRGFDLRERLFKRPEEILEDINKFWSYDHKRPEMKVAILHARCDKCKFLTELPKRDTCPNCGADIKYLWHFHNQVHDNTVMIKEAQPTKEEV